jgi:hypothetical protein
MTVLALGQTPKLPLHRELPDVLDDIGHKAVVSGGGESPDKLAHFQ